MCSYSTRLTCANVAERMLYIDVADDGSVVAIALPLDGATAVS
jgi:hypothetical protein